MTKKLFGVMAKYRRRNFRKSKKEKYFNSFLISDKDSLILIFEALSIMPNVHGMPTIEIPIKELNFYKGY